jgi:hypothetical protein
MDRPGGAALASAGAKRPKDECDRYDAMAGLRQRLRAWWNKDARELAEEEAGMTQHERDIANEDYEARKDDVAVTGDYLAGGVADYERDSEPPRPENRY